MSDITEKFFQLLRYAIDERHQAPQIEADDWESIFDLARKQSILGVTFVAIQRMGQNVNIPRQLKMKWFFQVNKIKNRNMLLNQRSAELVLMFRQDGFDCCVLKGQGNAMMYPDPYLRTSGDIDVLCMSLSDGRNQMDDVRDHVIKYVRKIKPNAEVRYYHVEFKYKDVPAEAHFMPGIMNNPIYNSRLQKWYRSHSECQMVELPDEAGEIPVPTWEFNIVFQLAHMMHHFFDEGIGLRQFIDYYYLLQKADNKLGISDEELGMTLHRLNLYQFAGAVMYVEREVLGLEEKYLIVPMDERRGKTLLDEILKGGNFGHSSGLRQNSTAKKYFLKGWRNMHFIREYPAEPLCEPIFRTWHFFWRLKHA